ncbi:MAG: amino acid adenylation domain-containing protein [Blastocatellia bacterium]
MNTRRDEPTTSIKKISRDDELPLSFAQQRLWFLDQLAKGSSLYNIPAAVRLKGLLDIGMLERALCEVVRRHEVLRTSFPSVEGRPVQVIAPEINVHLPLVDLSVLDDSRREALAKRLIDEEANKPFELDRGPLLRAVLLRIDNRDHIASFTMHHIISDGWSREVFFQELIRLYQAFGEGGASPLAELPIQYVDYASWQRQWLAGDVMQRQMSYWKQQLEGAPAILDLPTDQPRPSVQTHRGAAESFDLSAELTARLKMFSRREGVTLFMALVAAFDTLLYRLTGQQEIVVGTPIAGRNMLETEGLIGVFINTLALRTNMSGDPTFRELIKRVKKLAWDAYARQDVPFEKIVEALHPDRNMGHAPIFQVMLVLQNMTKTELQLPDLISQFVFTESTSAKFDLTLQLEATPEGLTGVMVYNSDLFKRATIRRMIGQFEALLKNAVEMPDEAISRLSLLTESQLHQIVAEWNENGGEIIRACCIHQLFEEQAEKTPDRMAVVFEDARLTYDALNRSANRLARHLIRLGVGPEQRVGICLERSVDLVIAILAILKAGGAYVPLDISYPKQWLAFMIADAQVTALLTRKDVVGNLPEHRADVIYFDNLRDTIASESCENLINITEPENSAYVIYTSGSTGKPKGVVIEHKSAVNLLYALDREIYARRRGSSLNISLNGSISFDTSVKQLIQLLRGHTLHIMPRDIRYDGKAMLSYLRERGLDVLDCTPTQLSLLLESGLNADTKLALRDVLVGGEAIDRAMWATLMTSDPIAFHNMYGPTESTVNASVGHIRVDCSTPTIGRPLANLSAYVLDRHLNSMPIGVAGELHIGGAGLARGYLDRPDLTAERFLPDPYSLKAGARVYKTGDLARFLAEGNIEFLGRLDNQVKVRGFRLELGEIEAVLGEHPKVKEAIVLLQRDKQLVAYVMLKQPAASDARDLSS